MEDRQVAEIAVKRCNYLAGLAQPCVVKNTFLHVTSEVADRRREQSAPPKLAQLAPEDWEARCRSQKGHAPSSSPDFSAAETDDTGASGGEADAMNSVGCDVSSDSSWKRQSSRQISTSSNFSNLSGDSEASPTFRARRGQTTWETCAWADTGSAPKSHTPQEGCMQGGAGGTQLQQHGHHHSWEGSGSHAHGQWWGSRMDPVSWEEGVTTVMVRQIPRKLSQLSFLRVVNRRGYEGLYDFLYLPYDSQKDVNVGYGFLNFVEPEYAEAFRAELDGSYLDKHMKVKGKPLRVHPAKMQGYEANYQHFSQTKTGQKQDPHFSPLFLPRHELASGPPAAAGGPAAARGAAAAAPRAAAQPWPGRGGAAMPVLFEGESPHGGARRQPFPTEQQAASSPWAPEHGQYYFGEATRQGQQTAETWAPDFHPQQYARGRKARAGAAVAESAEVSPSSGPPSSCRRQTCQF